MGDAVWFPPDVRHRHAAHLHDSDDAHLRDGVRRRKRGHLDGTRHGRGLRRPKLTADGAARLSFDCRAALSSINSQKLAVLSVDVHVVERFHQKIYERPDLFRQTTAACVNCI